MTDWGIANPNAFYTGAANMNSMLQRLAQRKAGKALNEGNTAGAVAELNKEGMIGPGIELQDNTIANQQKQFNLDQAHASKEMQFLYDTANVLNQVRQKDGDAAVLSAYDQLTPLFKQRGDTDEHIAQTRSMLQQDPGRFIDSVRAAAATHLKKYVMRPGNVMVDEQGNKIANAPFAPQLHVVPPGGQLVSQDPNQVMYQNPNPAPEAQAEQIPEEAISQLSQGHVTRFSNGQEWTIGEDGSPRRVK